MSDERLVLHYDGDGVIRRATTGHQDVMQTVASADVREHTCACTTVHPIGSSRLHNDFTCVVCGWPIDGQAVHVAGPYGLGGQYAHRRVNQCTVRQVTSETTRDHDCPCARIHPPAGFRIELPMICAACGAPIAAGMMAVHRHSDDVGHEQYAHRFMHQCGPQTASLPDYHTLAADDAGGDTLGAVVRPEDQLELDGGFEPTSETQRVIRVPRNDDGVVTERTLRELAAEVAEQQRDGFEVITVPADTAATMRFAEGEQPPIQQVPREILTSRGGWVAPSEALYDPIADDVGTPNAGLTELRRLARSIVNEHTETSDLLLITWDGYSITSTVADTSSVHGGTRRRQRVLHRYVSGVPGCRLTDPANGIRVSRNPEWRITVVDRSRFALFAAAQLVCPCVDLPRNTDAHVIHSDGGWLASVRSAAMNVVYNMAPAADTLVITQRDGPHRRDEIRQLTLRDEFRRPAPGPYDDAGTLLIEYGAGDDVPGVIGTMASLQVHGQAPLDRLITWEHTDRHMLHRYVNGRARCSRWSEGSDPTSREPWRLLIVDQAEYVHRRNQGHACGCLPYAAPYGGTQPMDRQSWHELVQDSARRFTVYPTGAGVAARVMVRGHEREADPLRPLPTTATTGGTSVTDGFGDAARRMSDSMNRIGRIARNTFGTGDELRPPGRRATRRTAEVSDAGYARRAAAEEQERAELEGWVDHVDEVDDLPDVDEYRDVEALVTQLASPIFRWRMATGLLRSFDGDPSRIEEDTPAYASARKRQMRAGDDVRLLVHAWCDAQRNLPHVTTTARNESDDD